MCTKYVPRTSCSPLVKIKNHVGDISPENHLYTLMCAANPRVNFARILLGFLSSYSSTGFAKRKYVCNIRAALFDYYRPAKVLGNSRHVYVCSLIKPGFSYAHMELRADGWILCWVFFRIFALLRELICSFRILQN